MGHWRRLRALERRYERCEAERAALIAAIEALIEELQPTPEEAEALAAEVKAEHHHTHGTGARRSPW